MVLNIPKNCFKTYLNHPINQKNIAKKKPKGDHSSQKRGGGDQRGMIMITDSMGFFLSLPLCFKGNFCKQLSFQVSIQPIWLFFFNKIFHKMIPLRQFMGKTSVVHPLVNSESCHAWVFYWAIWENIRQVELTQYGKMPYWASSTGRIFSRITQFRTLVWQLLRFTRQYTLSWRIYYSVIFRYSIIRWLWMLSKASRHRAGGQEKILLSDRI